MRASAKLLVAMIAACVLLMAMAQVVGAALMDGSEIALTLARGGMQQVYVIDINRGIAIRLTKDTANNVYPTWSPDGTKLAYVSGRDNNVEIYVINADGSDARNVTRHLAPDASPAWSPDSQRLAFFSQREGEIRIYIVNSDGSDLHLLSDKTAYSLAWSPDGTKLAFATLTSYYLYNFTENRLQEVQGDFQSIGPMLWLPNGEQIIFKSSRAARSGAAGGTSGVMVVNLDGSSLNRFLNIGQNETALEFSPDGTKLVLLTNCLTQGCEAIYVVNADGTNIRKLPYECRSTRKEALFNPSWSPDSQRIAFVSKCGEGFDLYTIKWDGSDLRRITSYNSAVEMYPAWRPH